MVSVIPVRTEKELKEFVEFPYNLYRNNRYWVPPLRRDVYHTFDRKKNPFWEHSEREMFIAYRGKTIAGRICAIVDYNFIEFWNEKTGYFGYFECENDKEVGRTLFNEVKKFQKEKGMTKYIGPFNPSTNDEIGLLLEGYFSPPKIMMVYTPEYYHEIVNAAELYKVKDLFAFYVETKDVVIERLERLCSSVRKRINDLKVRPLNLDDFHNEVKRVKEIYNDAWSRNWGFVPMTDAEFSHLAKTLRDLAIADLMIIVEVDDVPVGVSIAVPDYNIVLKKLNGNLGPIEMLKFAYYRKRIKEARLMIMGVRKDYQRLGLESFMLLETIRAGVRLGFVGGEMSWTLEDNYAINNTILKMGGRIHKKYRIYEGLI